MDTTIVCPACQSDDIDMGPLVERLRTRTTVTPTGCWEYRSSTHYPKVRWGFLLMEVHQIGLALRLGRTADTGRQALHRCDNSRCWNPEHLYEGSPLDNNRDRRERYPTYGRVGSKNPSAKLTPEAVADIRGSKDGDVLRRATARRLSERYGVSVHTVYRAAHGQSWREDTRTAPEPRAHWHKRGVKMQRGNQ